MYCFPYEKWHIKNSHLIKLQNLKRHFYCYLLTAIKIDLEVQSSSLNWGHSIISKFATCSYIWSSTVRDQLDIRLYLTKHHNELECKWNALMATSKNDPPFLTFTVLYGFASLSSRLGFFAADTEQNLPSDYFFFWTDTKKEQLTLPPHRAPPPRPSLSSVMGF